MRHLFNSNLTQRRPKLITQLNQALTLDDLARFIGQQLRNPEAHIKPHSTYPYTLIPSLSVEEALQREDLKIPDVLGTGQPSSSACL